MPETAADGWGQPIQDARKAELDALAERQRAWTAKPEANRGNSEFKDVRLTGAEVFWLAVRALASLAPEGDTVNAEATLRSNDQMRRGEINLPALHLAWADLFSAHLERAMLAGAYLEAAYLSEAHLAGADLVGAQLAGANLRGAHLDRAKLLEAKLERANLRGAWLDSKTVLSDATFDRRTRLGDIQWSVVGAVNLTRITWAAVPTLGDEHGVNLRSPVAAHEAAVRAYRQLAAQLRAQGMSEAADGFAARAQVRQRKLLFRLMLEDWRRPWRLPVDLLRWLFSWFLALLAGYGYHPGRSVFWYLATITGFAYAYFQVTHGLPLVPPLGPLAPDGLLRFGASSSIPQLAPNEALILSVSSFYGRGFFQPLKSLGDPVAGLAAIEAVIGLLIEISFIATFTQRFFGSRLALRARHLRYDGRTGSTSVRTTSPGSNYSPTRSRTHSPLSSSTSDSLRSESTMIPGQSTRIRPHKGIGRQSRGPTWLIC